MLDSVNRNARSKVDGIALALGLRAGDVTSPFDRGPCVNQVVLESNAGMAVPSRYSRKPRAKEEILMRYPATMIFFVLFNVAVTLIAVSHFIEARVEMPTRYPTGPEWWEHRQKTGAFEEKMRQCKDPVEIEKLYRQHFDLTEKWKKRIKPTPEKERTAMEEDSGESSLEEAMLTEPFAQCSPPAAL